jgi:ParB family chromosome partitioning protein
MTTKKSNTGFQTIALTNIHESTTNPRRTFDESKLAELADFVPGNKIGILWR